MTDQTHARLDRLESLTNTTATATTFAINWLTNPLEWTKAGATITDDNAYHTLDASSIVPSTATTLIIDGYMSDAPGGTDNADQILYVRKDSSQTTSFIAATVRGVSGNYTGRQGFQTFVPCTTSRTFDYLITNTITTCSIRVIGYI